MPQTNPAIEIPEIDRAQEESWRQVLERYDSEFRGDAERPPELRADADAGELELYGVIRNNTLAQTTEFLRATRGKDVEVRINSPGGDYFAGLAIANRLVEYSGRVTTHVDGLAASAAAVAFMAGETRRMAESAQLMFHAVWTFCVGNRLELQKIIDQLKASDDAMLGFLFAAGRLDPHKRSKFMQAFEAEKFLSRKDAEELGALAEPEEETREEEEDPQAAREASDIALDKMIAERLGYDPGPLMGG